MNPLILNSNQFARHPDIVFGISTRIGGVSPEPYGMNTSFKVGDESSNVRRNREIFMNQLGILEKQLAIPRQIHGDTVLCVKEAGVYESCDALITNQTNLYLTVSTADCVPIFLYHPPSESIAAIHSGWRGCRKNIIGKALSSLEWEFSAKPREILAFIGPSARRCCYEIGEDVAVQFDEVFVVRRNGKAFLDLLGLTRHQLLEVGLFPENIEVSQHCTICKDKLFHSFRRDRYRSGRMMGLIGRRSR